MAESLNVIALISGGKDSFFSILHCLQNGHRVVALGNLYPASPSVTHEVASNEDANEEDEERDLNSFMYQTVGHAVIPLYAECLGIPVYRQRIIGTAVQTGTSYDSSDVAAAAAAARGASPGEAGVKDEGHDETESLMPLLKRIVLEHPSANALSTGAILSTYQRTRIESVALRLGLTPLSYLWKYPILPPGTQTSLLQDMQAVSLDARIVKVSSGGLDESFLWENVASEAVIRRVEKSMRRFGVDGDGSVLGEGGEFETLVIDGPGTLFKGRIAVRDQDRSVVREGGGSAWLRISHAEVVMKPSGMDLEVECRTVDLLEKKFKDLLGVLSMEKDFEIPSPIRTTSSTLMSLGLSKSQSLSSAEVSTDEVMYWSISKTDKEPSTTISEEVEEIIAQIKNRLSEHFLQPSNIISTLIILRSMQDFASINKIYGALFTQPNPPARVTISCGSTMPEDVNITILLKIHNPTSSSPARRALHVQSRSYWAPANIGPYSQAISISTTPLSDQDPSPWTVSVAGQIALIPASMILPPIENTDKTSDMTTAGGTPTPEIENFKLQTILALQHLWRIGREMDVSWWTSAAVYLPCSSPARIRQQARIAGKAWMGIHARVSDGESEDDEEGRDLWEEKFYAGMESRGRGKTERILPDWEVVELGGGERMECSPFFAAEVEELPRGAAVEWHAHLGVVGGLVKVDVVGEEDRWTSHQIVFGGRMQLVVMISYSEDSSELSERLKRAFNSLGKESSIESRVYLSYLDESMGGVKEVNEFKGVVPCRSLWDISGSRLSAVLLLDLAL